MQKVSWRLAIALAVILLTAGGVYFFGTREKSQTNGGAEQNSPRSSVATPEAGALLAGNAASLLDFTKVEYEQARASDKLVVLYFYANWCPICKTETVNALHPAFDELTDERVIGFRVNYNDSGTDADERELAREFGVAYQHTKVFLKNGERVLKSPEGWDRARYLTEIEKAIQ